MNRNKTEKNVISSNETFPSLVLMMYSTRRTHCCLLMRKISYTDKFLKEWLEKSQSKYIISDFGRSLFSRKKKKPW